METVAEKHVRKNVPKDQFPALNTICLLN